MLHRAYSSVLNGSLGGGVTSGAGGVDGRGEKGELKALLKDCIGLATAATIGFWKVWACFTTGFAAALARFCTLRAVFLALPVLRLILDFAFRAVDLPRDFTLLTVFLALLRADLPRFVAERVAFLTRPRTLETSFLSLLDFFLLAITLLSSLACVGQCIQISPGALGRLQAYPEPPLVGPGPKT